MKEDFSEEEIELKDIIFVLKKRWKIILGISLLAGIIGLIIAWSQPRRYKATAILRVGRAGGKLLEEINDTVSIVKSNQLLQMIFSRFYGKDTDLKIAAGKSSLIDISGRGRLLHVNTFGLTPRDAEKLGEIVVEAIINRHRLFYELAERDLRRYLTEVKVQLRSLQRIIEFSEFSNEPTVVEVSPRAIDIPINSRRRVVLIALIAGLVFGIFIVFIQEYWEKVNTGSN